jgi:hypothetical protein
MHFTEHIASQITRNQRFLKNEFLTIFLLMYYFNWYVILIRYTSQHNHTIFYFKFP